MVEKDAALSSYRECVTIYEKDLASLSAEVTHLTTQHTVDNDLLGIVRTALALYRTVSQQRAVTCFKDREKMLSSKVTVDAEFDKFRNICKPRLIESRRLLTV